MNLIQVESFLFFLVCVCLHNYRRWWSDSHTHKKKILGEFLFFWVCVSSWSCHEGAQRAKRFGRDRTINLFGQRFNDDSCSSTAQNAQQVVNVFFPFHFDEKMFLILHWIIIKMAGMKWKKEKVQTPTTRVHLTFLGFLNLNENLSVPSQWIIVVVFFVLLLSTRKNQKDISQFHFVFPTCPDLCRPFGFSIWICFVLFF